MSTKTQNVALLGAGIFAKGVHLPALVSSPNLNLTAIYSRSRSTADTFLEAAAKEPSLPTLDVYSADTAGATLEDLLARADIDTVVLAMPINVQPAILEQAWKAGKHTLSEKPVAKDLASAKQLIALYESEYKPRGILWGVLEQYPFDLAYDRGKQIVASGVLGEIRSFAIDFFAFTPAGSKYHATSWRTVPDYQGGFLLDGGVHFFAGLRHILSGASYELSAVSALADSIHPHLPPHDTLNGVLSATPISASSEGRAVSGSFSISFAHEALTLRQYIVRGSKGTLTIDFSNPDPKLTVSSGLSEGGADQVEEVHAAKAVEEEFKFWGAAFVAGPDSAQYRDAQSRAGPRAVLRDLAVVEGALSSGGNRVSLKEIVGEGWW